MNTDNTTSDFQNELSPTKETKAKKILRIIRLVLDLLQTLLKKFTPSA